MANRLNQKIFMLQNNSIKCPKEKIKGLLNYMRRFKSSNSDFSFEIPLIRQQIANIIGLTVETVIRNIKILESESLFLRDQ
ncbi:helix-turn-helix domain-containing protein [Sphingobacterium daejeonense]|uniref:helix-turn-helix domain-containing protein n=1 Tax=Sphingobacterium daejeonense TaxID=371142 RepID=UPI003D31C4F4